MSKFSTNQPTTFQWLQSSFNYAYDVRSGSSRITFYDLMRSIDTDCIKFGSCAKSTVTWKTRFREKRVVLYSALEFVIVAITISAISGVSKAKCLRPDLIEGNVCIAFKLLVWGCRHRSWTDVVAATSLRPSPPIFGFSSPLLQPEFPIFLSKLFAMLKIDIPIMHGHLQIYNRTSRCLRCSFFLIPRCSINNYTYSPIKNIYLFFRHFTKITWE